MGEVLYEKIIEEKRIIFCLELIMFLICMLYVPIRTVTSARKDGLE